MASAFLRCRYKNVIIVDGMQRDAKRGHVAQDLFWGGAATGNAYYLHASQLMTYQPTTYSRKLVNVQISLTTWSSRGVYNFSYQLVWHQLIWG